MGPWGACKISMPPGCVGCGGVGGHRQRCSMSLDTTEDRSACLPRAWHPSPPPPPGDPPARRAGRRGAFSVPTPSVPPKGRRRSGGRAGGSSPGRRLPTSGGGGAYADPPTSSTAQEQTRASRTEQADLTGWCWDGPDLDSTRLGFGAGS